MNSPPVVLQTKSRKIKITLKKIQFKVSKQFGKAKAKINRAYRHQRSGKSTISQALVQTAKKDGNITRKKLQKQRKKLGHNAKKLQKSIRSKYFVINERRYGSKGMFTKRVWF